MSFVGSSCSLVNGDKGTWGGPTSSGHFESPPSLGLFKSVDLNRKWIGGSKQEEVRRLRLRPSDGNNDTPPGTMISVEICPGTHASSTKTRSQGGSFKPHMRMHRCDGPRRIGLHS